MLKEKIKGDSTEALKSGDKFSTETLRMLLAAITSKEKEKKFKEKLEGQAVLLDEEVVSVIISEIKKRKDAIALYEKGNRQELADKEKQEIEILKKYLPEQLSQEELKKMVAESIAKTGASEIKDTGKIMADLMPKVKGKADNSEISIVIKELLIQGK